MFDPHIKLGIEAAGDLHPRHLYSQPDDGADEAPEEPPFTRGITEWVVDGDRRVSFAWDWVYDPASRRLQGLWHTLRTNLVVVDDEGQDLGESCSRLCVARLMTRAQWEAALSRALGLRVLLPD